jgi:hypothetical protein
MTRRCAHGAETAGDQDFPVRLQGHGINLTVDAWIVSIGQPRDWVESSDALALLAANRAKTAEYHYLSVPLLRHPQDEIVRGRIERRVGQTSGGIETGKQKARLSANFRETAADQNLAIRLERNGNDTIVRVGIKGGIGIAGDRIEPSDPVAIRSANATKSAETAPH